MVQLIGDQASQQSTQVNEIDVDGVRVYVLTPDDPPVDEGRVILEIHGGGFITGAGECCRIMGLRAAARAEPGPGRWTTGCRRIIPTRPRSMIA